MQALLSSSGRDVQEPPRTQEKLVRAVEKKLESYTVSKAAQCWREGWREGILNDVLVAAGAVPHVNPSSSAAHLPGSPSHEVLHYTSQAPINVRCPNEGQKTERMT